MAVEYTLNHTGKEVDDAITFVKNLAQKIDASSVLEIDTTDNGKVLRVINGKWVADKLAVYNGEVID